MSQTILVADDSKTIRQIVGMALKSLPYRLVEASSARTTLDALKQGPDVILLDYYMPDGSGYDVCNAIKNNAATRHIPIVMMGGSYKNFDENRARQSGADQVIVKPFKTDDLIQTIEAAIAGGGQSRHHSGSVPAAPSTPPPTQAGPSGTLAGGMNPPTSGGLAPPPNPFGGGASSLPRPGQLQPPAPLQPPAQHSINQGSQPRIPSPTPTRASDSTPNRLDPTPAPPAISKDEMQAMINDEVKRAVREMLPEMLRSVLGNLVEQKLMPKMMQRTDERINQVLSSQLTNHVNEQVRAELERLLSD